MSDISLPQFRASKRRKTTTTTQKQPHSSDALESRSGSENEDDQATKLNKPRTQIRKKSGISGMKFSNSSLRSSTDTGRDEASMVLVSAAENINAGIGSTHGLNNRFIVSGMGGGGRQPVENDPNITAYIDAEMARRHQLEDQKPSQSASVLQRRLQTTAESSSESKETTIQDIIDPSKVDNKDSKSPPDSSQQQSQPPPTRSALLDSQSSKQSNAQPHQPRNTNNHHLTEIDLSILPPPQPKQQAPAPRKKKPKIRLGRDGKPFRPRPRPGPNPDDIARAELVEQVLSEGGFGTKKGTATSGAGVDGQSGLGSGAGLGTMIGRGRGIDEDADERMEREFTREFLERQTNTAGGNRSAEVKNSKETSAAGASGSGIVAAVLASGPRLGGSRSARARMVAALEKEREKEREKEKEMEGK